MKKFLQFKIQVVLMKDIYMLTFLLFAEMISVNGCVASYVSSVTICKKNKKKSGRGSKTRTKTRTKAFKHYLKSPRFFEHLPAVSELE